MSTQSVTDEQLRAFGISQRVIDLSRQPYMRDGAVSLDLAYQNAVMDAQDRVEFAALCILRPGCRIEANGWVRDEAGVVRHVGLPSARDTCTHPGGLTAPQP